MGLVVSWSFRITHFSDRVMIVSRKLRICDLSYLRLFASRTFRWGRSRIAYFSSRSFRSGKKSSGSDRDPITLPHRGFLTPLSGYDPCTPGSGFSETSKNNMTNRASREQPVMENDDVVQRHDVKHTDTERFFFSKPLLPTLYPSTDAHKFIYWGEPQASPTVTC